MPAMFFLPGHSTWMSSGRVLKCLGMRSQTRFTTRWAMSSATGTGRFQNALGSSCGSSPCRMRWAFITIAALASC